MPSVRRAPPAARPARREAGKREAFSDEGWLRTARRVISPNRDARPADVVVDLVVIHHISLPPGRFSGTAVEDLFCNRLDSNAHASYRDIAALRVSAHFLVRRRGELLQFVDCDARAWHAGASAFLDRVRCNDFSIGIELEGDELHPFTRAQYRRLATLIGALRARYPLRYVAGHSDIAPGRKQDPGPQFDWQRLLANAHLVGITRPAPAQK